MRAIHPIYSSMMLYLSYMLMQSSSRMPLLQHFLHKSCMSNTLLQFGILPGIFALEYLNLAIYTYFYLYTAPIFNVYRFIYF